MSGYVSFYTPLFRQPNLELIGLLIAVYFQVYILSGALFFFLSLTINKVTVIETFCSILFSSPFPFPPLPFLPLLHLLFLLIIFSLFCYPFVSALQVSYSNKKKALHSNRPCNDCSICKTGWLSIHPSR